MTTAATTNYVALFFLCMFAASCGGNKKSTPFPEGMELSQPVTTALKFTDPVKLTWPEARPVKPLIRTFDFNKLPSVPLDSSGFVPFSKQPETVPLDWDKLPDTIFNYDKLPSKLLKFEITALDPPQLIKTSLHLKPGSADMVYEFGEPVVNSSVGGVIEDNNGFIWIVGAKGVYRYDGANLALYARGSMVGDPYSMTKDNKDQIWIASGNGIYVINPKAGILKHLTVNGGLICNNVFKILLDKQGRIWAAGGNEGDQRRSGVSIIDENSNTVKWFGPAQGLSNFFPVNIMQDELDNIWITTLFGGVNIIDFGKGKLKYLDKRSGLLSDSVTAIIQDPKNRIWIADLSGKINVVENGRNNIAYYGWAQGLKRNAIWQLFVDDDKNIWLATIPTPFSGEAKGATIIDPERSLSKHFNSTTGGLSNNEIFAIVRDKRRQVWIATVGGLNIIHRNGAIIEHRGNEQISSLAQDRPGRIWVCLGNATGIKIIDSVAKSVRLLTKANGLSNDTVQNIRLIGGRMCITSNGGIDILDPNLKTITHLGRQQGLAFDAVTNYSKGDGGLFWISNAFSNVKGIDIYNEEKQTIQHLGVEQGITDSLVIDIVRDKQGNIWFTRVVGSPGVIDPAYKTIRYIKDVPGLNERYNKVLMADSNGNVWIGSGKGVFMVNSKADSVTRITVKEGLINDNVVSLNQHAGRIYAGTQGGLTIIGTPSLSSQKKWEFESFGPEQGISKITGSWESDMITMDGRFLWGDEGITSIANSKRFVPAPESEITGINIFNRSQYFSNNPWTFLHEKDTLHQSNPDTFFVKDQLPSNLSMLNQSSIQFDSVKGFYNTPVNLSLPYYQNYLQFHFAQLHGDDQDTTWYRYILTGADKTWSDRTYLPVSKNYFNLAPGSYTFAVASLFNGKWTKPAEFNFIILSPWWRTWWAYCLFSLALLALIYVIVQYRSRKLKAANLELEEKINQRTAELKQSLQELKATQTQLIQSEKMASLGELTAGIAHEIQNPLNFVNNFSEVNNELISEMKDEIKKGNIDEVKAIADDIETNEKKINYHGKRADAIVKNMLQHSRKSTGQKEPTDINTLCDEYLRLSYHGMRAKDKNFNAEIKTDFDNSIEKINIIPQDIGRVLLNLFNNAFYATSEKQKAKSLKQEEYKPLISVQTKKINDKIEIKVEDNGNGIPQNIVDKIFQPFYTTKPTGEGTGLGLSLSYDIIKAHGGEIKVEARENEGSEFVVQLPV